MQTKKKNHGRNSARELVSPKILRSQRKYSETLQVVEKNITELITSSARKRTVGKLLIHVYSRMSFTEEISLCCLSLLNIFCFSHLIQ